MPTTSTTNNYYLLQHFDKKLPRLHSPLKMKKNIRTEIPSFLSSLSHRDHIVDTSCSHLSKCHLPKQDRNGEKDIGMVPGRQWHQQNGVRELAPCPSRLQFHADTGSGGAKTMHPVSAKRNLVPPQSDKIFPHKDKDCVPEGDAVANKPQHRLPHPPPDPFEKCLPLPLSRSHCHTGHRSRGRHTGDITHTVVVVVVLS